MNLKFSGQQAAFLRVLQSGGENQTALVLLNKGDEPADFLIERYLDQGTWVDAMTGAAVTVDGPLKTTVPGHGVTVLLRDAPVAGPQLLEALREAARGIPRI